MYGFLFTKTFISGSLGLAPSFNLSKFGNIRILHYKLRIGHTLGPSTAIETALAIQEESGKFLSLGAGMGNVFSAAVIEILK